MINEGQLWIGGLASIAVIILLGFAFSFSSLFVEQYPLEDTPDLRLACDPSLKNAKFDTSLQSLSIQRTNSEQKIFQLLNNQNFLLNVDFIIIHSITISTDFRANFNCGYSNRRWIKNLFIC